MEVQLSPHLEKKLADLAGRSGCAAGVLVQDAVANLVDGAEETRATIDRRYDEVSNGQVRLIPGDEAAARLHARIDARHSSE